MCCNLCKLTFWSQNSLHIAVIRKQKATKFVTQNLSDVAFLQSPQLIHSSLKYVAVSP